MSRMGKDFAAMLSVRFVPAQQLSFIKETLPTQALCYALEKDGSVIGGAAVHAQVLLCMAVLPQWQHKGYGTYLLKQVLRALPQKDGLTACVALQNTALASFLQKNGFRCVQQTPQEAVYTNTPIADLNALWVVHHFLRAFVPQGGFVVDATAGNGYDTLLLAQLVGKNGRVLAMDVQQAAIDATQSRLAQHGVAQNATLVCDSHANLSLYAAPESADAIVFNFGYLPGGDHSVFTTPEVSLLAVQAALDILRRGGVLTACLYSGGAQKTTERDQMLAFFKALPQTQYTVMLTEFSGRVGGPIPVCVLKK